MSGYIMAGYHTVGTAIPYALFALSQNHDVQVKLQEEIDKTLGDRLPTFDGMNNFVVKHAYCLIPLLSVVIQSFINRSLSNGVFDSSC